MAEFKLGRIKFVYQGTWQPSTAYVVDDVVTVGGKTYICVVSNTSSSTFATDLSANPTNWNLVADGSRWTGNWTASTYYLVGDQVLWGGIVYQCLTAHTSGTYTSPTYYGLEANQSNWVAFASNFNWLGAWNTTTRYKVRDLVTYGGYTYVCNTAHVSATTTALGLENDQSKWDTFNAGIIYRNAWSGSSVKYRLNDIVTYGADLWICTTAHVSTGTTLDGTKFSLFVSGFEFQNSWSSATNYIIGDMVTYGGNTYSAIANNSNQNPSTATLYWQPFTTGFTFAGDWNSSTAYKVGSIVRVDGYTYLATSDNTNQQPPNTSYWQLLNSSIRWKPTQGTYTNISGTNVVGTGTGATFDITRSNTVYSVTVHSGSAGTGYANTNTIKILGTSLGGATPANDLTITVTGNTTGAITTVSASGISVSWTTGTTYVLGDVVLWGVSSYICIQSHVGSSGNRPDNDTVGAYWNLLASGTEQATLTTQGDMFYYGANGPTRLPIGADGQILRVNGTSPAWQYYGQINNIVYVSNAGTDTTANGQGTTIDKPWATIRYACYQIENGYLNPNTTQLLAKNKQFMMKEVSAYVVYNYTFSITNTTVSTDGSRPNQITVGSGTGYQNTTANMTAGMPISFTVTAGGITSGQTYYVLQVVDTTHFTITATAGSSTPVTLTTTSTANVGSLVYSTTKCERDAGLLIDAVVHDVGRGGTYKSYTAAQSYFNNGAFITTNFGYQAVQSNASFNYLKNYLFPSILGNTAPSTNYQTLITASTPASQIIDTTLTAETNALSTAQGLLSIVTNAISAQSNAQIPAVINPNTTISVKTGTYNEILPIVVPAYTAIVGDELRSTVVQPAAAISNLVNDKPKSIAAWTRIQTIIPTLISNSVVTASAGNSQALATTGASSSAGTSTILFATQTSIPFSVGQYITVSGVTPTGFNGSYVVTACTTGSVSFAGSTSGPQTVAGVVSSQVTALPAGDIGSTTATASIKANAELMYDIVSNGISNVPSVPAVTSLATTGQSSATGTSVTFTFATQTAQPFVVGQNIWVYGVTPTTYNSYYTVTACTNSSVTVASTATGTITVQGTITSLAQQFTLPIVPGYNVTFLQGYGDGIAQITRNYQFVKDEISNYLNDYYSSVWNAIAQSTCQRDVGLLLDALQYDMSYGCNTQTLIAGSSYFSNYISTISTTETAATLAAYGRLKTIIGQIITASAVSTSPQTSPWTTAQTTSGTPGSAAAATFAQARIQEVIDWINNGAADATILPTSAIALTSSSLQTAYTALQAKRSEIQADTVSWVQKFYQALAFNSATCSRDTGYIVDALSFDLVFGSNFNSITVGRSYNRNISSVNTVRNSQLAAELGAINFIKYKAKHIAASGSVAQITNAINDIIGYINNGATPRLVWPDTYSAQNANTLAAAKLIWQNKAFIQAEVSSYLSTNYSSVWNGIIQAKCTRDVGYIVDALRYDVTYGGNWASLKAGKAYYSYVNGTEEIASVEQPATLAAMLLINKIATAIAQGGTYVPLQTTTQRVIGTAGTSTQATTVQNLMYTIYNIINNGNTLGVPLITITTITGTNTFTTGTTSNTITQTVAGTSVTLGTAASYIQGTPITTGASISTSGGLAQSTTYYVTASTTSSTTVTLSSSLANAYAGTAITFSAATYSTNNTVTVGTANHGLSANDLVIPQAGSNGFATGQIYYVASTGLTSTQFQLSATWGGTALSTFTNGTGLQIIAEADNNPSTSSANATGLAAQSSLQQARATIQTAVINYITTTYPTLVYNSTLCSRDVGYVIDAIGYDMMFGSNFQTVKSGMSYYEAQASKVIALQKSQTLASFNYLATQIATNLASNATAASLANTGMITFINILTNGIGETPEVHGTLTYNNTLSTIKGAEILRANKTFLAYEASAYISSYYTGTVTSTTASTGVYTTTSNHNLAVGDPVVFTGTAITNSGITIGTTYYILTVPTTTSFTLTATQNSSTPVTISANGTGSMTVTYYYNLAKCLRDTTFWLDGLIYDLNFTGTYKALRGAKLYNNAVAGSISENMFLVRNSTGLRNMTMTGITGYLSNVNSYGTKRPTGGAYASLDPGFGPNDSNVWIYARSCYVQNNTMFGYAAVGAKVDAALHNGGYKSMVANDYTTILGDGIGFWVTGSGSLAELVSVFNYYGYAGYLSELGARIRATNGNSSYGTYGVIAEGVDTYEVPIYGTINNRYFPANVTNTVTDGTTQILRLEYGNAGQGYSNYTPSISGSGYNASAIGDEFRDAAVFETRIIDTGTTSNPSVGGTSYITATNVSQGGNVGYITLAATDTALSNAYNNMRVQLIAGTAVGQYANILTFANGTKQANIIKDSFQPLFITATNSSGYLTVSSTASLYANMPIYLGSNIDQLTGAYQSGIAGVPTLYYVLSGFTSTQFKVGTSSNGSALPLTGSTAATVSVTSTNIVNNLIVASNSLNAGQAITFSSSFNGIDAGTLYYVLSNNLTTTSFAVSTYLNGPAVTITTTGSVTSTGTVGTAVFAAGWDHVIPGATVQNIPDLTSGYIVEPRITYSNAVQSNTARTLPSGSWTAVTYGAGNYVAVQAGANIAYSTDGKSWTGASSVLANTNWSSVVYGGGQGATATVTVGGFGGSNAVLTATVTNQQVTGITIVSGGFNYTTPPTIVITGGGGSGATATCTVLNGAIATVTITVNGSQYTSTPTVSAVTSIVTAVTPVTWGKNYFTAINVTATVSQPYNSTFTTPPTPYTAGGPVTSGTYYQVTSTGRIYLCTVSGTTSGTIPSFDYTSSSQTQANGSATLQYIATQALITPSYTNNGISSYAISVGGYGYTTVPTVTILDSGARFVAVSSLTTAAAFSSVANLGTAWTTTVTNVSSNQNFQSLAYGGSYYVAVGGASGTGTIASSSDGNTWIGRAGPSLSAGYWSSVAYGNGRFIAVNNGGRLTTVSTNSGSTWTAGGLLPNTTTAWTSITYGNGRFVVTSSDGINVAYSYDGGTTWLSSSAGMPVNQPWSSIAYGEGQFVAVASMPTPTITATSSTGNLITLSSTAGLNIGNSIVPTQVTETGTATQTAITTATSYSNAFISAGTSGTSGTVLTAPTLTGTFANGMLLTGGSIVAGTYITATNTFSSTGSSISGSILTTGTVGSGTVAIGQAITLATPVSNTQAYILNTAYLTGTQTSVLALTGTATGTLSVGEILQGTGIANNAVYVTSIGSYSSTVAIAPGSAQTIAGTISGTTLTLSANSGSVQPGMVLTGGTVAANTFIVGPANTTTTPTSTTGQWTVSISQTATGITAATPIIATTSGTVVNTLYPGMVLSGGTVTAGTIVTAQASATAAAVGTYTTTGGTAGTYVLNFSANPATFAVGQLITGTGIFVNTFITNIAGTGPYTVTISNPLYATGSGSYNGYAPGIAGTYYVTPSQTVTSTPGIAGTSYVVTQGTAFAPQLSNLTANLNLYIINGSGSTWNLNASATVASTAINGTSYTVSTAQNQTGTTITGTNNLITVNSTTGMTVGEPIVFTAVTQTPTVSLSATGTNLITVSNTAGLVAGEPITFTAVTQTGTTSLVSTSGNAITVSNATGLVVGEQIVFTAVTQTPTLTATTHTTSSMTGYISNGTSGVAGTVLTVMFAPSSTIYTGMVVSGGTVTAGTYILNQLSATNTAAATTTATASTGVSTITVASATGILANQYITAAGIPAGTYVSSSYTTGTSINLVDQSGNAVLTTAPLSTTAISFYTAGQQGTYTVSVSQVQNTSGSPGSYTLTGDTITVSTNANVIVGESFLVGTNVGNLLTSSTYWVTGVIGTNKINVGTSYGATTNFTLTTTTSQSVATTIGSILGGITSGSTYYVASVTGTTNGTITVASIYGGSAITITGNAAGNWTWVAGAAWGNLSTVTTYYILTISGTTNGTITISTSYGGSTFAPGAGAGAWNATAGASLGGITSSSTYFVTEVVSGTLVSIGNSYGATSNLTLTAANGAWTFVAGAVLGNLSSGSTYYIASIAGNQITVATSYANAIANTGIVTLINDTGAWTTKTGTIWYATSWDGLNWALQTAPTWTSWGSIAFGNPYSTTLGYQPLFAATSKTTGTNALSIRAGARAQGRVKVASGLVTEIRLIEPGSGYAKGNVTATTVTTNVITVDDITGISTSLANNQPIEFNSVSAGGLSTQTTYYVIGSSVTTTVAPAGTFQVTATLGGSVPVTLSTSAPTGMIYTTGPIVAVLDPNHVVNVGTRVRTGDGVLGNPSFSNRGSNNATATSSISGDGYSDLYQNSQYINIAGLYNIPSAGANVQFASITGNSQWYKLVTVTNQLGVAGNYTAQFTINPALTTLLAPNHGVVVTTRLKYSQVRLTGHDFLYIGTGNQTQTNYPYVNPANAVQANQSLQTGGGRVFFTSTDQDGNFNVGNLFGVQQSTGTATLNASAFNLAGLQSLTLGAINLGVGSATITQFSTDPYFTANSDNILPTQKAIKSFITAQIGGGQSTLNVNTITAGQIYIAGNSITNTTGNQIYVTSKMYFVGGVDGAPVALAFFGQK